MALAWVLRDNGALGKLGFTDDELAKINKFASDAGINLRAESAELDV